VIFHANATAGTPRHRVYAPTPAAPRARTVCAHSTH